MLISLVRSQNTAIPISPIFVFYGEPYNLKEVKSYSWFNTIISCVHLCFQVLTYKKKVDEVFSSPLQYTSEQFFYQSTCISSCGKKLLP